MSAILLSAAVVVVAASIGAVALLVRRRDSYRIEQEEGSERVFARGRIGGPGERGEPVYEADAVGSVPICERFELRCGERGLLIDPSAAVVEAPSSSGGQLLRVGDRLAVSGLLKGATDDPLCDATRIDRLGWPRLGLLGACTLTVVLVIAVALVHYLSAESGCPAGAQRRIKRRPTSEEIACVRGDDVRHGQATVRDYAGRTISEGTYRSGLKEGRWQRFYRNGAREEECDFVRGARHGLWRRWHRDGARAGEARMSKGSGRWTGWHPNGKRSEQGRYVRGERQGSWTFWRAEGGLHSRGSFERGLKHGSWTAWHANGKRAWVGSIAYGKRHGYWRWWREGGAPEKEGRFERGKKHGSWRWSHENGKPSRQGDYRQQRKHGRWTFWDDKGGKALEGSYRDGARVGRWTWWCERCAECDPCAGKSEGKVSKDYGEGQIGGQRGP